ncbi:glycosyltransferase family 39 protein [Crocosphaera sp. UHCC 0190]|uniref:ArnT family glycosyltransferase n=1 Tax=Crocosphaera sp. UHCC 0190 TaxID=3110246 RepID=UPI002B208B5C|nr:glycosyltransferase family 39 protein [Crocosphaera sp. UHCC 0190]MEA5510377.1 glycosyltransferase family 39 protein [Crocosphaera sp. UHCC 0190]
MQVLKLSIITIIAAFIRIVFLDKIPNGFFPDEASNAYDAYSILRTGKDQYGHFLPLVFKSANDYREGLYIYLMVPFIKILGLNEFAARMTSAMIGTLTVLIIYYLVKEVFNRRVALSSALLLAIYPWHIQFSRIAFRAILFPCLFCLSLLFFFKSLKQPKYLPLSGLLFSISIFTYQSARVFVPLFLIGLIFIFYQFLWQHKFYTLLASILFLLFFIPQLIFYISPQGMTRANDVILSSNWLTIIKVYFSHFSPEFLFFKGDLNPRHLPQHRGELYYFEMITIPLGLFYLIKEKRKENIIFLIWLILYPLPAALTSEIHSLRAIIGAPLLAIISGYGITKIVDLIKFYPRFIVNFIVLLIISISLVLYSDRYFIDYPRWLTHAWLPTMGSVITYGDKTSSDCIVIDTNVYGEHIYIFVPFYGKLDPNYYQKLGVDIAVDRLDMGRWKVENLNEISSFNSQCLYITTTQQLETIIGKGYKPQPLEHFKDINGEEIYQVVKIKS